MKIFRFNRYIFLYFFFFSLFTFRSEAIAVPFSEQAREAMELYLKRESGSFLDQLNNVEQSISSNIQEPVSIRVDRGEELESRGIEIILGLMEFKRSHNEKMDRWATTEEGLPTDGEGGKRFFDRFKMDASIVRDLRGNLSFSYATIHWYPFAIWSGLEEREIPLALRLERRNWETGDGVLQRYTLFSFYRKLASPDRFIKIKYRLLSERYRALLPRISAERFNAFLRGHTGFATAPTLWNGYLENVTLKRWRYDYYTYQYVRVNDLPATYPSSLIQTIVRTSIYQRRLLQEMNIGEFYQQKVGLFKEVADEILVMARRNRDIRPYWSLYSFICRTFPYISAFKLSQGPPWSFINGYKDDSPARGSFVDSVMGKAHQLWQRLGGNSNELAEKTFGPIFLLQQRDLNPEATDFEGQFIDVKVGFKGFYDYFRSLIQ